MKSLKYLSNHPENTANRRSVTTNFYLKLCLPDDILEAELKTERTAGNNFVKC